MSLRDVTKKTLASPKMSKVRPLSPYMNRDQPQGPASGQHLLKYAIAKKDPSELLKSMKQGGDISGGGAGIAMGVDSPRIDAMDEQSICNSIPISKFKSNHLSKRRQQMFDDP